MYPSFFSFLIFLFIFFFFFVFEFKDHWYVKWWKLTPKMFPQPPQIPPECISLSLMDQFEFWIPESSNSNGLFSGLLSFKYFVFSLCVALLAILYDFSFYTSMVCITLAIFPIVSTLSKRRTDERKKERAFEHPEEELLLVSITPGLEDAAAMEIREKLGVQNMCKFCGKLSFTVNTRALLNGLCNLKTVEQVFVPLALIRGLPNNSGLLDEIKEHIGQILTREVLERAIKTLDICRIALRESSSNSDLGVVFIKLYSI